MKISTLQDAEARPGAPAAGADRRAQYAIGQVVKHRFYDFRGVIYDVDSTFSNSEAWYESIPEEVRPARDQPYYHLLAENAQTTYEAYVSEQNLLLDDSGQPCRHPQVDEYFERYEDGRYVLYPSVAH